MKLFLTLLFCILFTHGLRIYKNNLITVHKVEKNKIIARMIIADFNRIYHDIYYQSKLGKNETQIKLRCAFTLNINDECIAKQSDKLLYRMDNGNTFEIPYNTYTHILLKKIKQIFPHCIIVPLQTPCCAYIISW